MIPEIPFNKTVSVKKRSLIRLKKVFFIFMIVLVSASLLFSCDNPETNGHSKEKSAAKKLSISSNTVTRDFMNVYYKTNIGFGIGMDQLLSSAFQQKNIKVYSLNEAIREEKISIPDDSDLNDYPPEQIFVVIVSGEVILNPELQFYTRYNEMAAYCVMIYNSTGELEDYDLLLSSDLQGCAALLMTGH